MLIKCCLNGGTTREEHPGVPGTPDALAAAARAAVSAGAGAIHLHPRDPSGAETLGPGDVLAAVHAVRAAAPGVPVGVTTGIWAVAGNPELRLALASGWTGADRPDFASVNLSEPGTDALAAVLRDLDIAVEAGVWSVADADRLAGRDWAGRALRILIEPPDRSADVAVAAAASVMAALDRHDLRAPRLHHGYGAATWHVIRAAIRSGHDIRVGLEDTVVLPDGRRATGNGELIAAAVRMAAETFVDNDGE
jgi:uncharacterized protein (DUF849 family)